MSKIRLFRRTLLIGSVLILAIPLLGRLLVSVSSLDANAYTLEGVAIAACMIGLCMVLQVDGLKRWLVQADTVRWSRLIRLLSVAAVAMCVTTLILGSSLYEIDRHFLGTFTTRKFVFFALPAYVGAVALILLIAPLILQVNILILFVLLIVAEISVGIVLSVRPLVNSEAAEILPPAGDGDHGTTRQRVRKTIADRVIYDVVYTLDKRGRRVTPPVDSASPTQHALFFGRSFTFGAGPEDNQTVPHQFARLAPAYRPYNFGQHGRGPSDALNIAMSTDLRSIVADDGGVSFFLFIDDHIRRVVGSLTYQVWGADRPRYVIAPDGGVTRAGTFMNQSLFKTFVYALLNDSLPIRLTPMTATCRVPPLSRVKLGIGWSRGVARDAEQ